MSVSRRQFLSTAVAGAAGLGAGSLWSSAPVRAEGLGDLLTSGSASLPPSAAPARLGTLLDYAVGIPSPEAISHAGHAGVIRYISDRRPGAEYMTGKPVAAAEATAMRAAGLTVVSNYQFGKAETADWKGGYPAGRQHAARGLEIHRAAGGPDDAPIYVSIDDNPTHSEFLIQIAPYLLGWRSVIGSGRMGVYANAPTISRVAATGLARWFWQHDWGTPKGYLHPAAHLHQLRGLRTVGGVNVDVNAIEKPDYGQWR